MNSRAAGWVFRLGGLLLLVSGIGSAQDDKKGRCRGASFPTVEDLEAECAFDEQQCGKGNREYEAKVKNASGRGKKGPPEELQGLPIDVSLGPIVRTLRIGSLT